MITVVGGGIGRAQTAQTYNRRNAVLAKVELRSNVLELVQPAHVFDAFCGPDGEMYRDVWSTADSYVGCDTEFKLSDTRRRFVGDNRRVMRAVDLSRFNVFDFDAFGSPWEQMLILAARRRWREGELGGVVVTDGAAMKCRRGAMPYALAQLLGTASAMCVPTDSSGKVAHKLALRSWANRSGVRVVRSWQAESKSSGIGSQTMTYSALVFEGARRA